MQVKIQQVRSDGRGAVGIEVVADNILVRVQREQIEVWRIVEGAAQARALAGDVDAGRERRDQVRAAVGRFEKDVVGEDFLVLYPRRDDPIAGSRRRRQTGDGDQ